MSDYGAHLLGRVAPVDNWHLQLHPFVATAVPQGVEVELKRPTLDVYDQGQTPHCVAYSTSKVVNWFNHYAYDAEWLYARCKEVDGMPHEDGTNARAACDILRSKGHWRRIKGKDTKTGPDKRHGIASNTWAASVDEIRSVFASRPQPVLIGIPWHEAWFSPVEKHSGEFWLQDMEHAGPVVGGHEIAIFACSDRKQAFGLSNTWGNGWLKGDRLAWLPYSVMTELFGQGADACVLNDLPSR